MSKKIISMLLAVMLIMSLCACGETPVKPQESDSISVTDLIGREVSVTPGSYKNVVCIGAGALRMYSYIGDMSLLCGVEDIDNTTLEERPKMFDGVARAYVLAYGDLFSTLPSCGIGGPNAQAAEAEKILSCSPDIIISMYGDVEKEDALEAQTGVPVITIQSGPNGVFEESFRKSLELLGTIFGREERAKEILEFVDAEAAEIEARTKNIADEDKPGVYICGLGNWGTTNHLMTVQSYVPFQIANVRNVVTDLETNAISPIEEEKFVSLGSDMDVLIIDSAAVKNIKPLYEEDPGMFDTCKAWQTGRVCIQLAYNAYYTNYETNLINTWFIAKSVYPELFADIDMTAKTNEITKLFLGKELAAEMFSCPASYGGYISDDAVSIFS